METNIQATKQVIILKKIMEIENVSFNRAIQIIDALNDNNLLDYYLEINKLNTVGKCLVPDLNA